jgi:DNA adenine methylase
VQGTSFLTAEYKVVMRMAKPGDMIYCDPPYSHSQSILYGAQSFSLEDLLNTIAECKARGVHVALSIDGTKRSGDKICDLPIPKGLFEKEAMISCGRSMLKRFQMNGKSLEDEVVADSPPTSPLNRRAVPDEDGHCWEETFSLP